MDEDIHRATQTLSSLSMSDQEQEKRVLDPCNIFVKYLPSTLGDDDLAALFEKFGRILSSKIMVDPTSRKSLGFGFVRFSTADEANEAINTMNGHRMGAKRLLCKLANTSKERESPSPSSSKAATAEHPSTTGSPAFPRTLGPRASSSPSFSIPRPSNNNKSGSRQSILQQQQPSNNLYIKPLLLTDDEETLKELFGTYGNIVACKVMVDRLTGMSRQIGFVRFEKVEEATLAIQGMHGSKRGDAILNVKYADDDRQKEIRKGIRQASIHNISPNMMAFSGSPPAFGPPPGFMIRRGSLEGRDLSSRNNSNSPRNNYEGTSSNYIPSVPWAYSWATGQWMTPVFEAGRTSWVPIVFPTGPDGFAPVSPVVAPNIPIAGALSPSTATAPMADPNNPSELPPSSYPYPIYITMNANGQYVQSIPSENWSSEHTEIPHKPIPVSISKQSESP